jgi:rhamnogalacturonyl hydrolase YesR
MKKKTSPSKKIAPPKRAATSSRVFKETWRPESQAPAYTIPYGPPTPKSIRDVLKRIHSYIDRHSPACLVDRKNGRKLTGLGKINSDADMAPGLFRLISYEWGVVSQGMMLAFERTGDPRYRDYAARRLQFLADASPRFKACLPARPTGLNQPAFISIVHPHNLDDAGSLCAAMVKAHRAGLATGLAPLIDHFADHIVNRQYRLPDGTFARHRPLKNSLWLDDLYMSVPALAQMYKLTGNTGYAEEAVNQLELFSRRMFNKSKCLYMHGWYEDCVTHPEYHWGRANGWAMLALVELLDVLPDDHPRRGIVLGLLRRQISGVAACQSGRGFWHQLLDRNDSFPETSATAIFTYCMARAINRGWADALAYGPAAIAGWNAVASRVNAKGQVEGTCVGSAMAMDPVYYYHRPQSALAAHGYGPALLAGAELLPLVESGRVTAYDGAVQFGPMLEEN